MSLYQTNLFRPKQRLTPAELVWAHDAHIKAISSQWSHLEVGMTGDIADWRSSQLSSADRSAIGGILRGFTLIENLVADHWTRLSQLVPKPEFAGMAAAFSAQEGIHAYAYAHLEDSLGLDSYAAFVADPIAQAKLQLQLEQSEVEQSYSYLLLANSPEARASFALNVAFFAGFTEGTSLFSSFAILLSYCQAGLFKGMNQLLSWSVRDESAHSDAGIELFRQLVAEYPDCRPSEAEMHKLFSLALANELSFIANAFADCRLLNIDYAEAKAFAKHRCDKKLIELGYSPIGMTEQEQKDADAVANWFYPATAGTVYTDFFAQAKSGSSYASSRDSLSISSVADLF